MALGISCWYAAAIWAGVRADVPDARLVHLRPGRSLQEPRRLAQSSDVAIAACADRVEPGCRVDRASAIAVLRAVEVEAPRLTVVGDGDVVPHVRATRPCAGERVVQRSPGRVVLLEVDQRCARSRRGRGSSWCRVSCRRRRRARPFVISGTCRRRPPAGATVAPAPVFLIQASSVKFGRLQAGGGPRSTYSFVPLNCSAALRERVGGLADLVRGAGLVARDVLGGHDVEVGRAGRAGRVDVVRGDSGVPPFSGEPAVLTGLEVPR